MPPLSRDRGGFASPSMRKLYEKGLIQGKAGGWERVVHTRQGLELFRASSPSESAGLDPQDDSAGGPVWSWQSGFSGTMQGLKNRGLVEFDISDRRFGTYSVDFRFALTSEGKKIAEDLQTERHPTTADNGGDRG